MPINLTDVDAFTDPVVAPVDADPANAASVVTPLQALANRTRNAKNRLDVLEAANADARLDALEPYVRADLAASRGCYLHGYQGQSAWNLTDGLPAFMPNGGYMVVTTGTATHGGILYWGVAGGAPLPNDATITDVRVFVQPGAARATSSDRMRLQVFREAASGLGLTQLGSDVFDNGGTGLQTLALSGLSIRLNTDESGVYGLTNLGLTINVRGGMTAGSDRIYMAEIRYTTAIR